MKSDRKTNYYQKHIHYIFVNLHLIKNEYPNEKVKRKSKAVLDEEKIELMNEAAEKLKAENK